MHLRPECVPWASWASVWTLLCSRFKKPGGVKILSITPNQRGSKPSGRNRYRGCVGGESLAEALVCRTCPRAALRAAVAAFGVCVSYTPARSATRRGCDISSDLVVISLISRSISRYTSRYSSHRLHESISREILRWVTHTIWHVGKHVGKWVTHDRWVT